MKEGQPNRLPSGKIADGSGAPPTLKGFGPGQAKLVVITDNAEKMRLVAFWRDRLPRGWRQRRGTLSPRHADHIPVGFGAGFTVVRSEQSVVAVAGHAFVINRVLSGGTKPIPTGGSLVRSLLGESMRPPKGIAIYRWDRRRDRWQVRWTRTDVGKIPTVPMLSRGSEMVVVDGTLDRHPGKLSHFGFDLESGAMKLSINTGADLRFNGAFTGIKSDGDRALTSTTLFGLVRFDVDRMAPTASPDYGDYRCTPSG